jgi:peptidoglycan/LPS O-acetylase OafA/YrhL
MGVCLGRLYLQDRHVNRRPRLLLTGLSIPLLAILLATSGKLPFLMLHNGLLAPVFALLIYHLAHRGAPSRALSAGWIVLLGEASYALYILHYPLGHEIYQLASHFGWPGETLPFPIVLLGLIAASVVTFRYLEVPARGWVRGVLSRRPERAREAMANGKW